MANLRIKGDTSGYVDLVSPDVAGAQTINLDRVVEVNSNGYLGIGTTTPTVGLELSGTGNASRIKLIDGSDQINFGLWDGSNYRIEGDANRKILITSYHNDGIHLGDNGSSDLVVKGGNVSINSTSPDLVGNTTTLTIGNSNGGGDGMLSLQSGWGNTTYGRMFASAGQFKIGNPQSNNLVLYTANLDRLKINENGYVTMPQQPGFAAVRNSTYNYSGGTGYNTISGWYNSTTRSSFNTGGHFNYSTGVFTAPVSGKYTFKFQVLLQSVASGDDSIHIAFYCNGSNNQFGNIRAPGTSASYVGYGGYLPVIGSTDVYLSANDTFDIRLSSSGNIDVYGGVDWSRFSGYLIG